MKKVLAIVFVLVLFASIAVAETCDLDGLTFELPTGFIALGDVDGLDAAMNPTTQDIIMYGSADSNGESLELMAVELLGDDTMQTSNPEFSNKVNGYKYVSMDISAWDSLAGKLALFADSNKGYYLIYVAQGNVDEKVFADMLSTVQMSYQPAAQSIETQATDAQVPSQSRQVYQTLQKGDKGEEVRQLQLRLIELNWLEGNADGDFGNKTKAAVESFQKAINLAATGIADNETQVSLYANDAPMSKVYGTMDYKTLARDPGAYIGNNYAFEGKVLQVLEEDNADGSSQIFMRVATKSGYDNVCAVWYTRGVGEGRILEDDRVKVRGTYNGLYSYDAIFGNSITIPEFYADSVTLK